MNFKVVTGTNHIKNIGYTRKYGKQFVCAYLFDSRSIHKRIRSVVWQGYADHKSTIPNATVVGATVA